MLEVRAWVNLVRPLGTATVQLMLWDLETWELFKADCTIDRMVTVSFVLVNISRGKLAVTEVTWHVVGALVDMLIEEFAARELVIAPSTLGQLLALTLVPIKLKDRELL